MIMKIVRRKPMPKNMMRMKILLVYNRGDGGREGGRKIESEIER